MDLCLPTVNRDNLLPGITSLYFIFNFNFKKFLHRKYYYYLPFYIISFNFCSTCRKIFIEPFVWLLFFSLFYSKNNQDLFFKYANNFIIIISTIYLILLSYYSINLFKVTLIKNYMKRCLRKTRMVIICINGQIVFCPIIQL